jgi:transcriptional regulator with XRE-family HTH domain
LSQREVAEMLRVPPRTFSYYESADGDLPSSLLVPLADVLGVGVHELLGPPQADASRRVEISRPGPKSMIEKRVEALRELPRKDQQFVVKFLDQVIEDYQRRRRK